MEFDALLHDKKMKQSRISVDSDPIELSDNQISALEKAQKEAQDRLLKERNGRR